MSEPEMRDYIVTNTDSLISKYGFKSVTMDDIAKHLGMSKKTIYQYFEDKNDLVNVLIEAKLNIHDCELRVYAESGADAVHEVFLSMEDMNGWLTTLNPKLIHDLHRYYPKAWLKLREFRESNLTSGIANNLKRGIAEGLYHADLKIDIMTELRLGHTQIIFNAPVSYSPAKYNLSQVMNEVTLHFLNGICTERGRALIEKYQQELRKNTSINQQ